MCDRCLWLLARHWLHQISSSLKKPKILFPITKHGKTMSFPTGKAREKLCVCLCELPSDNGVFVSITITGHSFSLITHIRFRFIISRTFQNNNVYQNFLTVFIFDDWTNCRNVKFRMNFCENESSHKKYFLRINHNNLSYFYFNLISLNYIEKI